MPKIRAIIVDDEPKSRQVLGELLALSCPDIEVVGEAAAIDPAVACIERLQPDLVFFDILLQEGDSFEIIRKVKQADFEMIFVTAYDQESVKALTFSGVQVLLKPIQIPDLIEATRTVVRSKHNSFLRYQMADGMLRSAFRSIPVITDQGLVFKPVEGISWAEDGQEGCVIHFEDGSSSKSERKVRELMQVMDQQLFTIGEEGKLVRRE